MRLRDTEEITFYAGYREYARIKTPVWTCTRLKGSNGFKTDFAVAQRQGEYSVTFMWKSMFNPAIPFVLTGIPRQIL